MRDMSLCRIGMVFTCDSSTSRRLRPDGCCSSGCIFVWFRHTHCQRPQREVIGTGSLALQFYRPAASHGLHGFHGLHASLHCLHGFRGSALLHGGWHRECDSVATNLNGKGLSLNSYGYASFGVYGFVLCMKNHGYRLRVS